MERAIYTQLLDWKDKADRKPLILLGARQVGKTYILKQFSIRKLSNMVYINCYNNEFMANLFTDFDIDRIIYIIKDNSTQEVDFLVQTSERIVPTEVKTEENVKSKSLSTFIKKDFKELNLKGLCCSMKPYIDQSWMENIPLYAVEAYFD